MIRVDFHTHSVASPDGSLCAEDYKNSALDFVAITDHNTIEFAQKMQKDLGQKIIVGEEITAAEGELVGLFLRKTIPQGLSVLETAKAIKAQGGLVYVPHPFETVRNGLSLEVLSKIVSLVDIVEVHNGRAVFQDFSRRAEEWADEHDIAKIASSDAHGSMGWGRTFTVLATKPMRDNLIKLLREAKMQSRFPGFVALMYPKFNRLRKSRVR